MGMIAQLFALPAAQVASLQANPAGASDVVHARSRTADALSLEKAWHGLHFALTGSATDGQPPLNFLLDGGRPVGRDGGYGPPRLFTPAEVATIDVALGRFGDADLDRNFDPAELEAEGVYPGIWDEDVDELREEYLTYLRQLRTYVGRAAKAGDGLLVAIT